MSKKHIHNFNPKTNFRTTVLNQPCEKKKKKNEMAVLARKFQKQEDFFNKAVFHMHLFFQTVIQQKMSLKQYTQLK